MAGFRALKSDVAAAFTTNDTPIWDGTKFVPAAHVSAPAQFTAPAFDTPKRNTTAVAIWLSILVGVVSGPQQNGHIYLDVSPDNGAGTGPSATGTGDNATGWTVCDYVACRNNQTAGTGGGTVQAGGPNIGSAKALQAIVPDGYWYRLRTHIAAGYSAPTFVFDGAPNAAYARIAWK